MTASINKITFNIVATAVKLTSSDSMMNDVVFNHQIVRSKHPNSRRETVVEGAVLDVRWEVGADPSGVQKGY